MKKSLRTLLCLCLAVLMLGSMVALAADPQVPVNLEEYVVSNTTKGGTMSCKVDDNNKPTEFTATLANATGVTITASKQYVLLVVKLNDKYVDDVTAIDSTMYSVESGTIFHIDQKAGADGSISFTFMPKSVVTSVVLVAGEGITDPPAVVGVIKGKGVSVSGKVTFLGSTPATVKIYDENKIEVDTTTTDSKGVFSFGGIPEGKHYLVATRPGYVGSPIAITVSGEDYEGANITLYAGDVNGVGGVEGGDLLALCNDFGKTSGYAYDCMNLNDAGGVEGGDLLELCNNFGKTNVSLADFNQ